MSSRGSTAAIGIVGLLLLLFVTSCEKELEAPVFDNPLDPGYTGAALPDTPTITRCAVGDRLVVLEWSLSDTSGVASYRVYRSVGSTGDYSLATSLQDTDYSDTSVSNGTAYYYRVCAVTRDGIEGKRSEAAEAVPAPFSVTIADGREYTTLREVSLRFSAPGGTYSVLIANGPLFAEASWQMYTTTTVWELEPGDGKKTVWARFRDELGHESVAVADSIILDTKAFILSLDWTPSDSVLLPGSTVRMELNAGEPNGQAWVNIGGTIIEHLELLDDGSQGDLVANDGKYARSFMLPAQDEFYKEPVVGDFRDEAGNAAFPFTAPRLMTVAKAPEAVTLLGANVGSGDSGPYVELTWTQNNDLDFVYYRIYRDASTVTLSSLLVGTVPDRGDTHFEDTTVVSGRQYRYKVYVVDALGLSSGSNEVSVTVP